MLLCNQTTIEMHFSCIWEKGVVLYGKQSLCLKEKKIPLIKRRRFTSPHIGPLSVSSTPPHSNTILHTVEKDGVCVENQTGKHLNFSSLHYSANSRHELNFKTLVLPMKHRFEKTAERKKPLWRINIGSFVTTTRAKSWTENPYAIPLRVTSAKLLFSRQWINPPNCLAS